MSDELLLNIKQCIENKTDDKNELKKAINKLIDKFYKVKREPTEYNIFIKEQMLLLKDNKEILAKDKMQHVINLWNEKKAALLKEKYPDNNGLKYNSRGYRRSL
jgi:hypothetical protein